MNQTRSFTVSGLDPICRTPRPSFPVFPHQAAASVPSVSNLSLSFFLLNVRSICNKLDTLKMYVDYHRPDILALTETWGRPSLTDALLTPPGYSLFRRDRRDRFGGGVAILIRNELVPTAFVIPDNHDKFEDSVWAVVRISSTKTLLVGCLYRSPSSVPDNDARLVSLFDFACQSDFNYCIIGGDFNSPDINWTSMEGPPSSQFIFDSALDNFLSQLVLAPTRGSNTLDLVFVNDPTFVSDLSVTDEFPGSDHKSVSCFLTFDISSHQPSNIILKPITSRKLNLSKADWPRYRSSLAAVSCEDIFASNDIDVIWSRLKSRILSAAEDAIPSVSPPRRFQGIPLCGKVRVAFRNRRRIFRELRGSNSSLAEELRAKADEELNSALSLARRSLENEIARTCIHDPKRFWSHIRSSLGSKPKVTSVVDNSGALTKDDASCAEVFNTFFASVFTEEPIDTLPSLPPHTELRLNDFTISIDSVLHVVKNLHNHSSPGPDGISNPLIKEGGLPLITLLVTFFRLMLDMAVLPSEWKCAIITPIFKKGSRTDCKNFRPISLTCTLCKVFERLLKDAMLTFLLENNLLGESQHGFLPNRSCCTALLSFLEEVTLSVDNRNYVDAVYLDFSKAFDSVPHRRLIIKLQSFGFDGSLLKWIVSFLTGRKQQVKIGNSLSSPLPVTSGVPQGSVLGPLLFVIFIEDIDRDLKSKTLKFADDIRIFSSFCDPNFGSSVSNHLQDDLSKISNWCATWLLKLSPTKCSCIHFGYCNPMRSYNISDSVLPDCHTVVDLGITISDDLKPSTQCFRAAARANRMIGTIKLAFKFLDVRSLSILYKAFVLPLLDYCSVVWCPYYVKDIEVLERVQRRFTRILPAFRDLPYKDRLKHFQLTSLFTRRLGFDLVMVYKITHNLVNLKSDEFFDYDVDSRTRGHGYKIRCFHSRLDIRKHFFTSRVIPVWNSLPRSCVDAANVSSFKILLRQYFTSVDFH